MSLFKYKINIDEFKGKKRIAFVASIGKTKHLQYSSWYSDNSEIEDLKADLISIMKWIQLKPFEVQFECFKDFLDTSDEYGGF